MSDVVDRKTQHESMMVDESEVDRQLQSPITKLNVDCFEEWFEWLSLADLLTLRRTCKRLQQVVDYFIRTNYAAVKIGYGKFHFRQDTLNEFEKYDSASIKMIKHLGVFDRRFIERIDLFKVILPQIEKFRIGAKEFNGNFYELVLKWCSKLKYLSVSDIRSKKMIGDGNQWLSRQYPMLEHIELRGHYPMEERTLLTRHYQIRKKNQVLKEFFELNPNIQTFSTNARFLVHNYECLLGSNIKIDRLDVMVDTHYIHQVDGNLLNKLYDQGFYKRLHMYYRDRFPDQDFIDKIVKVHGMEKLYLQLLRPQMVLPPMPNLRELAVVSDREFDDWETIARNWVNLERIYFYNVKSNVITLFLRYSPKLKEIKVNWIRDGSHFENGIIDLAALNKERGTLTGATKVTIYVEEDTFLSTKFAKTKTEFSLVTLKRVEAVEWIHQFH